MTPGIVVLAVIFSLAVIGYCGDSWTYDWRRKNF